MKEHNDEEKVFIVGLEYTKEEWEKLLNSQSKNVTEYHPEFKENFMQHPKYGSMSFSKYMYEIVKELDEEVLDTFGEYVPGLPNSLVSPYTKVFLWLEYLIQDKKSNNAIEVTSSWLVVERIGEMVEKFNKLGEKEGDSVEELYYELKELLFDYLDGC